MMALFCFLENFSCLRPKLAEVFICVLIVVSSFVVSCPAFAWFFIFPGSLRNVIADDITGEEGLIA